MCYGRIWHFLNPQFGNLSALLKRAFREVTCGVLQRSSRTKFSMESKFGTERGIRYGGHKTLRNVLGNARFPKEKGHATVQLVKRYGRSKILQIQGP